MEFDGFVTLLTISASHFPKIIVSSRTVLAILLSSTTFS